MKGGAWAVALGLGLLAAPLHADPPVLDARVACERAIQPGRVVCELTSRARSGTLVWGDVLVVRAPDFARPLRSRLLTQLSPPAAPELVSSKLALVATRAGEGKLELLVRAVVCQVRGKGDQATKDYCLPASVAVSTSVRVEGAAARE